MPQHQKPDEGHTQGGKGGQDLGGKAEGIGKHLEPQHNDQVGEAARKSLTQHIEHKISLHPGLVWLQSQKKGGDANGQRRYKGKLDGHQGIGHIHKDREQGKAERENIFDQVQGSGTLDVVDDPPSLGHHLGKTGKVRIQQHQLGGVAGSVGA